MGQPALTGQLDRYNRRGASASRDLRKCASRSPPLKHPKLDMTRIDGLIDQITRSRADQWKESLHAVTVGTLR